MLFCNLKITCTLFWNNSTCIVFSMIWGLWLLHFPEKNWSLGEKNMFINLEFGPKVTVSFLRHEYFCAVLFKKMFLLKLKLFFSWVTCQLFKLLFMLLSLYNKIAIMVQYWSGDKIFKMQCLSTNLENIRNAMYFNKFREVLLQI